MDEQLDVALVARERLNTARAAHLGIAPRPMCVLQVVPALETGGVERTTVDIAAALVAAGERALVASAGGRMVAELSAVGGEHITLPTQSKNVFRMRANAAALADFMEREGVDIIHARSRAPAWSALWAAAWTGRQMVTTYHGAYSETTAFKNRYNSVMARGDVVIANSAYTAALIAGRHPFAKDRIVTIARGTDLSRFGTPAAPRGPSMRERWDVTETVPVILHMARLTTWKGQAVVLDALAKLQPMFPRDWVCVFAGDDQGRHGYTEALQAQAGSLGLSDHVRFAGHVSDMPAAFLAADVAIVASTEPEAFGRTAAEAQAVGTPVIATAIGAPRETVLAPPSTPEHAATGRLVAPGDPDALAGAIAALLALDPNARAAMAARARTHVETRYSVHQLQDATLRVYDELLNTEMATMFRSQSVDNL
ncbi:MAG: glycosyltransferase family 4 protein [Pseudomonadota bacterium]